MDNEMPYFLIHILVFIIGDAGYPVGKAAGIILHICILLFMQSLFSKRYSRNYKYGGETVFLMIPCGAALCISVMVSRITSSLANVILFQKMVQYHEENGKRTLLENQVRQMRKEIAQIQDIYTDMRGLRHDMRSHLANISLLTKGTIDSVNEELESYIGKMEETVSSKENGELHGIGRMINTAFTGAIGLR